ncbi:SGNH/GDSL hydrolase family protein [Natronoglycomyces albus]|uniref:SGNH/GDSL hydrolase family protein n=1 Tax=Natronoglycomyces albus TaxID=2811108 RepID=A0A895XK51_9ACTN|nr:SGNH/GDSL hydrolase family protein [Natronoglycomyces albus]QSB05417.1 SGNH/GDSL hydrolase family protein [Natronoglycomyces albus]
MTSGIGRFIAVGDSFTEGLSDQRADGSFRGWADLVARQLADDNAELAYANLAVRGRLFDEVVDQQVPEAIKQHPDLVSFCAGINDALRPGFHAHSFATRLHEVVRLLKASGADVILFTSADMKPIFPGAGAFKKRFITMNEAIGRVARRHNALLVDVWDDKEFRDPRYWNDDRLHYSPLGHKRIAARACQQLDIKFPDEWLLSPQLDGDERPAYAVNSFMWAGKYLAPWVKRRLTKTSSGDDVQPKRPVLSPVDPTEFDDPLPEEDSPKG